MWIYKIINIQNNKIYIGQTIRPVKDRFHRHINDALNNNLDTHFARAIRKYGKDSFIIEIIDEAINQIELNQKEQYWIQYYNSIQDGYNETDAINKCGGNTYQSKTTEEMSAIKEKLPNKTVWCYTGFDYEKQLIAGLVGDSELTLKCLRLIDVLVDGKFVEELKSPALLFRGSSNQRIIDVKKSLNENKVIWLDGVWERKMGSGNIYE